MQHIQELDSKSEKKISLLIEEVSSSPKLTIIESPGGFIETKEKTRETNKNLIDFCSKNSINYLTLDFSNNNTRKDQPVNELRFGHRVKDLESAIDFVKDKYNSPIILLGSSLGGFITLNAANYSEQIKGLILNCAAVKAHICVQLGISPSEFNNWKEKGIAIVWGMLFKYDFYEDLVNLNAIKMLPNIKKPILWFHGTDDMTVPISQAHEAKYNNKNIELIEVQGGGHRFGDKMQPEEWEEKVEKFILNLL